MSGHSKWSSIKRKKGAADAKRGQLFTKLAREIQVAAREGGGDPEANFRLRLAVQKARTENMPLDNIQRAIQRGAGTGGDGASHFEEVMYEGYGPHGVAFIVQTLTDNRNRTVSEVRSIFTKAGGSLGESGSVAWMFEPRGLIFVEPKKGDDPDELSLAAIDAGAEDVAMEEDQVEVVTAFQDLKHVQDALVEQGMQIANAETTMVPKTTMSLEEKGVEQTVRLIEKLEELDDVQTVYTNLDLTGAEELIESMS